MVEVADFFTHLAVRIPYRDADTRTEIGQVGAALNLMLGRVRQALRRFESESRRMTTLVDDLLLLTRLESGSSLPGAATNSLIRSAG